MIDRLMYCVFKIKPRKPPYCAWKSSFLNSTHTENDHDTYIGATHDTDRSDDRR